MLKSVKSGGRNMDSAVVSCLKIILVQTHIRKRNVGKCGVERRECEKIYYQGKTNEESVVVFMS